MITEPKQTQSVQCEKLDLSTEEYANKPTEAINEDGVYCVKGVVRTSERRWCIY